jgi:hypothetical protein
MAAPALWLLIGLAAPASAAEPPTAEEAMRHYREAFPAVDEIDCPKPKTPDEIVVCGRSNAPEPYRLPLPAETLPGARAAGEPVTAVEAMGKIETCSTVGPNQMCGGGLPIIPIIVGIVQVAVKAAKHEH